MEPSIYRGYLVDTCLQSSQAAAKDGYYKPSPPGQKYGFANAYECAYNVYYCSVLSDRSSPRTGDFVYLKDQQRPSVARVLSVGKEGNVEVASYNDSARMTKKRVSEELLVAIQACFPCII